jgi:rubrerythrin
MEDNLTIAQAIRTAMLLEEKVFALYRKAAAVVKSPGARMFLELMAEEEEEHMLFLAAKLTQWKRTGKIPSNDKVAIPPLTRREIDDKEFILSALLPGSLSEEELALYVGALEIEREAFAFYGDVVSRLPEEGRLLFEPFLEIEEEHVSLVETKLKYLLKPTDFSI